MSYFTECRRCGHTNAPDATVCIACHHPLDPGIQQAMSCPVCGLTNAAGVHTCSSCGYDLIKVEQLPVAQRTLVCPYCQTANPPPVQPDAAAYCISCGREIQLPGAGYSLAQFTPDKDVCPRCGRTGTALNARSSQPSSALAGQLAPPRQPAILRAEGESSTEPPGEYHVEVDAVGDPGSILERVWDSELSAFRSILGPLTEGVLGARRVLTTRYHETQELWQSAYYCETDQIVFVRRLHAVRTWSPQDFAEEIRREIPPGAS
jgi:DNA-directed RNA polymerase subunit RPC12/RpoP